MRSPPRGRFAAEPSLTVRHHATNPHEWSPRCDATLSRTCRGRPRRRRLLRSGVARALCRDPAVALGDSHPGARVIDAPLRRLLRYTTVVVWPAAARPLFRAAALGRCLPGLVVRSATTVVGDGGEPAVVAQIARGNSREKAPGCRSSHCSFPLGTGEDLRACLKEEVACCGI